MASCRLALPFFAALLALQPATAEAQFRYLTFGELRERFTNRVFGTDTPQARWDMISEFEPGFRLYYARGLDMAALSYRLMLQLFARTPNEDNSGPLVGYANFADLQYSRILGSHTEWSIIDRVAQGTENTIFPISLTETGAILPARLTIGSRFVSNSFVTGISHNLSEAWALRVQMGADYAQNKVTQAPNATAGGITPNTVRLPSSNYGANLVNRVDWNFGSHMLFFHEGNSAYFDDATAFDREDQTVHEYPHPLATYVVGAGAGWRWYMTRMFSAEIGGGFEYAFQEEWTGDPAKGDTDSTFRPSISPTADVLVLYQNPRDMRVALSYSHRWMRRMDPEFAAMTETDQVGLSFLYALRNWHFEAGTSFIYVRNNLRVAGQAVEAPTKSVVGDASVAYVLNPYLSLEAGYRAQGVFDQPPPPGMESLPTTYVAHYATVGLSVVWPGATGTDLSRLRRVSEAEPLFRARTAGGAGGGDHLTFEPVESRSSREQMQSPDEDVPGLREQPGPEQEVPPLDQPQEEEQREQEHEQDPGYYSWPR